MGLSSYIRAINAAKAEGQNGNGSKTNESATAVNPPDDAGSHDAASEDHNLIRKVVHKIIYRTNLPTEEA